MAHLTPPLLLMHSEPLESREVVNHFMSALESMCKEFARVKAEVACIAIYESEAMVIGSKKGKAFLDARKDFQKDFIQYCNLDDSGPVIKPVRFTVDSASLRKSVEDLFCICYGKAIGKSSPVPIPYDKIMRDPTAITVCGLPKDVPLTDPLKYDTETIQQILANKHRISFSIKRPFLDGNNSKDESITAETEASYSESYHPVQVKAEPSDDSENSFTQTTVIIKEEAEDQDYYKFNFKEEFLQNTDVLEADGYFTDISSGEEPDEQSVNPGTRAATSNKIGFMFSEDMKSFLQRTENKNTLRKTMCDIHNLQAYFSVNFNEVRPIYDIPPGELSHLMSHYLLNVRKKDNSEYEPLTLRSIFQSTERYLKQVNYPTSMSTDAIFKPTRDALKLKQRELKTKGKGCRQNASDELTDELIHQLYVTKQLGPHNAYSLQNTMWLNNCIYFGIRGNIEMRQLRWGDIILSKDNNGNEYLQYDKDSHLKNHVVEGQCDFKHRPKAFANPENPERCPVMNYKIFTHHRPPKMQEANAPFYLAINWKPSLQQLDPQWYKNQALGIHSIETILKTMVQRAGIRTELRITNLSATKLLLQKMQGLDLAAVNSNNNTLEFSGSNTQHQMAKISSLNTEQNIDQCSRPNTEQDMKSTLFSASHNGISQVLSNANTSDLGSQDNLLNLSHITTNGENVCDDILCSASEAKSNKRQHASEPRFNHTSQCTSSISAAATDDGKKRKLLALKPMICKPIYP